MNQQQLLQIIEQAARDQAISLNLSRKGLTVLPPEIGQLTSLAILNLDGNELTALPAEIGKLTNLVYLYLNYNRLPALTPEIGQLSYLRLLDLRCNELITLPLEISQLTNLVEIDLYKNPLTSLPPEIVSQGTRAILAYLRGQLKAATRQWVSKMLLVGQGGVGKTCLLRALRGEPFASQETTHGILIRSLALPHPTQADATMQLMAWDFGGQEIYHATHQFFLTNRSLFLLVWNARHGYEQGRLYQWLDTIHALAPDSPVLLVATWIDERSADLPLADLCRKYPQIVGHYAVSNKTGQGIDDLRQAIAAAAAALPLMGEKWPTTWLNAANALRASPEKYVTPAKLRTILATHGVRGQDASILAQWLHELGDILYFRDNEELSDLVILKPQWVTEYISKVLESQEVQDGNGIFTRQHMEALWPDLDPAMREHFLCLMERFDLSYRTLENREISLVVERLPLDPPDYTPLWDTPRSTGEYGEIAMRFQLSTVPSGIPTWFIARSHRFTTHTHWRNGAVFAYERSERRHLALVQAFPHDRYVQLTVRGPNPQNFFALMKDGLEVTLARFPGLQITRLIPCPGHNDKPCSHEFDYEQLLKRVRQKPMIECPETLQDVSVTDLLFGLHWSPQDQVLSAIEKLQAVEARQHEEVLSKLADLTELTELMQREFTKDFRREQSLIESHCPNVFTLRPRDAQQDWREFFRNMRKAFAGQTMELQLYCQAPGCWHPTGKDGLYIIREPAKWLRAIAPYVRRLVSVLKYASPLVGPWLGVVLPDAYEKQFKNDIKLMEELVKKLPDLKSDYPDLDLAKGIGETADIEHAEGTALRALRLLLDEVDRQQKWGGLKKVLTPEGHYLWLCEYHAAEYAR